MDAWLGAHDAERHPEFAHPRSSQAACLQVFGPAAWGPPVARSALARALSVHLPWTLLDITGVHFEAPHGRGCLDDGCPVAFDARDLLGEHPSRHTRLDVLITGTASVDGRPAPVGVGIEFKYTEPELGCCGGFVSRGNTLDGQRACLLAAEGRRERCYLHTARERRAYLADRSMWATDPLDGPDPCPLLGPINQLYRSHYTVRAIAGRLGWADSAFLVAHPGDNPVLLAPERRLPGLAPFSAGPADRYAQALRPDLRTHFGLVTTPEVLAAYQRDAPGQGWVAALIERYGPLREDRPTREAGAGSGHHPSTGPPNATDDGAIPK